LKANSAHVETVSVATGDDSESYEAPAIVVLGNFAELTQQGTSPTDELLNDGSQV
jgi:hypothetical protein